MRKKIVLLTAVLVLSGCKGGGGSTDKLGETFSCTAEIGEQGISARLERAEGSGWNITLTAPETVKGMQLSYLADGKCSLSFEGHTAVYERSELPEGGVFDLAVSAADMCIEDKGVKTFRDGEDTVRTGTVRGIGFSVRSREGKLTEIEFNGGEKLTFDE